MGRKMDWTMLELLRADDWAVAVHNDYRQDGKPRTFWLLTHPSGVWAKGEGATDEEAIEAAAAMAEKRLKPDGEALEALAAAEHDSWTGWTKWMLEKIEAELLAAVAGLELERAVRALADVRSNFGIEALPSVARSAAKTLLDNLPSVVRWRRQMGTPYAELSEKERESDREEARKKIAAWRSRLGRLPAGPPPDGRTAGEVLKELVETPVKLMPTVKVMLDGQPVYVPWHVADHWAARGALGLARGEGVWLKGGEPKALAFDDPGGFSFEQGMEFVRVSVLDVMQNLGEKMDGKYGDDPDTWKGGERGPGEPEPWRPEA